MNLKEVAQVPMLELASHYGDAISMTIREGEEVVYIAHVPSEQKMRYRRSVGSRLPAHATSTGLVMLAFAAPEVQRDFLERAPFTAFTGQTPSTAGDLARRFKEIARQRYALARDTLEYGAIALAVPIQDVRGRTVAALNCASSTAVVNDQVMIDTRLQPLQTTALKIQAMLQQYPALAR